MKKIALTLIFSVLYCFANGQTAGTFNIAVTAGAGFALTVPAVTPLELQVATLYNVNQRFAAGVGVGLSSYENLLLPVFADLRFLLTPARKFTPFAECTAGYAFPLSPNTSGGLYFHPSAGIQYAVNKRYNLLLSIGYEHQSLRRLKSSESDYFVSEFEEWLTHGSVMFRFGVCFW
jgi:hypothetical protein